MKKFVILAIIQLLANLLNAQTAANTVSGSATPYRYEVGLNLFMIPNLNFVSGYYESTSNSNMGHVMNGIQVKRHLGNYALRAGFQYTKQLESMPRLTSGPFYQESRGYSTRHDVSLGVQRKLTQGRHYLFAAIDALYTAEHVWGDYSGYGDFPPYNYSGSYNYRHNYLGIALGLGFRCAISDRVSLNAEANASLMHEVGKGSQGYVSNLPGLKPVAWFTLNYNLCK